MFPIERYLPEDGILLKTCYRKAEHSFVFALAAIGAAGLSSIAYATKGCLLYAVSLIDGNGSHGKTLLLQEGKKSIACLVLTVLNIAWALFNRRKIAIAPPPPPVKSIIEQLKEELKRSHELNYELLKLHNALKKAIELANESEDPE